MRAGRTAVKICGIATQDAYEAADAADYIGFVFFPPSPRHVTPAQAAQLAAAPGPVRVGLFIDPTDAQIADTLAIVPLDVLQLFAPPDRISALRARFGLPVWRAVGVQNDSDLPETMQGADALLLDAKPPRSSGRPGGNAVPFDWSVLPNWQAPGNWLLAGGLTPSNVASAIALTGAPAVDVSSGVERSPGVKDPAMISAFIQAARHG